MQQPRCSIPLHHHALHPDPSMQDGVPQADVKFEDGSDGSAGSGRMRYPLKHSNPGPHSSSDDGTALEAAHHHQHHQQHHHQRQLHQQSSPLALQPGFPNNLYAAAAAMMAAATTGNHLNPLPGYGAAANASVADASAPELLKRQRLDNSGSAAAKGNAGAGVTPAAAAPAAPRFSSNGCARHPNVVIRPSSVGGAGAGSGTAAGGVKCGGALDALSHKQRCTLVQSGPGRQALLQLLDPSTQCMVECGSAIGIFSITSERVHCMCGGCAQKTEGRNTTFLPSEFERHAGMAACKKWRFSIKVGAAPLE